MHILQLVTNFRPGGIQRHVLDLTAALRDAGHQVTLAGDDGDWRDKVAGPDYIALPMTSMTWEGGGMLARLRPVPRAVLQLRRELARRQIDLIHSHETAPALVARLANFGAARPLVMTYHGAAPEREAEVARMARFCADKVISPSHRSLKRLIDQGLDAAKTQVLGLGVPAPAPIPEAQIAARRAEMLGTAPGPLIFSLSRMSAQKGIDDMIAVAQKVIARHPGAVFAVAGGGPMTAEITQWVAASGLGAQFRLLGPISAVAEHLQAADLYLLTSRWENLPISIVEAFRAGLPVIATDGGGVRELVDDQVGALCPVGAIDQIADEISLLLADPANRHTKAAAALDRSKEPRFDPAHVHQRFAEFYAECLLHAPGSHPSP